MIIEHNSPPTENKSDSRGFLADLEYREDLVRLCLRLVSDAVQAKNQAEWQNSKGDAEAARRYRSFARVTARRALHVLQSYRAAEKIWRTDEQSR